VQGVPLHHRSLSPADIVAALLADVQASMMNIVDCILLQLFWWMRRYAALLCAKIEPKWACSYSQIKLCLACVQLLHGLVSHHSRFTLAQDSLVCRRSVFAALHLLVIINFVVCSMLSCIARIPPLPCTLQSPLLRTVCAHVSIALCLPVIIIL